MIIIGKALVSEDILERKFACQLHLCKGACCVQGDAGAPLQLEEIEIIENEFSNIRPFLDPERIEFIRQHGFHSKDVEGETGTACLPGGECVFVVYTNDVAQCGIERAYNAGKTWFKKPLSCHLYPIRSKKYGEYTALNYHNWEICAPACKAGAESKIPVHEFLREALIRKMGPGWYKELEAVSRDKDNR
jgi:hypothetical protein